MTDLIVTTTASMPTESLCSNTWISLFYCCLLICWQCFQEMLYFSHIMLY